MLGAGRESQGNGVGAREWKMGTGVQNTWLGAEGESWFDPGKASTPQGVGGAQGAYVKIECRRKV